MYHNAFSILKALRERNPQGLPGHELRGQEMSDDEFVVAAEYLESRKAIKSNAVPVPPINKHYFLMTPSDTQRISNPADLLEQDIIVELADYVGQTLQPYRLPEPLTSDLSLLEVALRRLSRRGLLTATESEDVKSGKRILSSIVVHPDLMDAKLNLDYGIQDSKEGAIVQNIQIAHGSGNVQVSGNNNQVQNAPHQGFDIAQACQALDKVISLIQESSLGTEQKDIVRTDALNLRTELQREKPALERIQTYWNTLMTTIQGIASVPGLMEAAINLGRQLGMGG